MSKSKSYRKYAATTMAVAVAASAVAPVVAGAEEIEFSDVSKDSPHYDAIIAMAKEGIIQGDNGKFAPYDNVYRIQVAKMLQRTLKLEVPSNANQIIRGYTDITENYTQEDRDAIAAVTAAGIFQGGADGKFNAWTPINREQMASVIVRAFGLDQVEAGKVNINLSNVDKNHRNSVQILANLGLTDSLSDYKPAELTNREQFASFLYRTTDAVEEVGFKVADVIGLDDYNRYLQVSFNQKVSTLEPSNIKIVDAKSNERYGVKSVNLASDGLSAQVELFAHEGADEFVLKNNRDYIVTVNANGQTSEYTFNRPAFMEERVVAVNIDDNQITVNQNGSDRVLKVLADIEGFDFQEALGEKARIWYNEDNEVVDFSIDESSTEYDAIEITKNNEIKMLTDGSKHKFSKDKFSLNDEYKVTVYKDGEQVTVTDGKLADESLIDNKYNFSKVGFDKSGNVEYISIYNLKDFLIVDEVDGNDIIGVEGTGTGGEFDAKDATVIKDNKVISLSDIEKGDILFFSEDANDKDGFAEVYNNTVTGEIENVYKESVRIDGDLYDFNIDEDHLSEFDLGYTGAVYLKEDGKVEEIDDRAAEKLQAAGEVAVYLDRAGHPVFFGGDLAEVQANTKASILLEEMKFDSSFKDAIAQIEVVTQDGEEELHQVTLKNLRTISFNGEEFDVKNTPKRDDEVSITWEDGKAIVDGNLVNKLELTADEGDLINVIYNDSGKVTGLELFGTDKVSGDEGVKSGADTIEAGDSYVEGYRLLSNTIVFDATDGFKDDEFDLDADDVSVTTWGDYKGSDINNYTFVYNDKNEVVALVIKETTTTDEVYESTVITDILRNTDDEIVEVKAYIDGKEVWLNVDKVDNDDLEKGNVAIFEFSKNDKDLVKDIITSGTKFDDRTKTIDIVDVKVGSREVVGSDGKTYRLVPNGAVLDVSDSNDIDDKRLRDLEGKENVTLILDSDSGTFVKYFIYGAKDNTDQDNNAFNFTVGEDVTLDLAEGTDNQFIFDITPANADKADDKEIKVTIENSDGNTVKVESSNPKDITTATETVTVTTEDPLVEGEYTVTVKINGVEDTFTLNVITP